ncbi:PadR family transcriptional regulator [Nocardioides sp. CER19]|uniref:PadR family transcriptional regulator n=1 Tax=Nocardioides sp. CER19 TaxID=3038538 RepID=UPI0024497EB0|nr:PadR family transcriptional regulator [Nocardioides sp. CER19]MDH2412721.1 PadR family transcriptional regulator [Nocardioides sp. CER19]
MNDNRGTWREHQGRSPWGEWTDQPWGGGRGHRGGPPPWAAALFGQAEQRRGPRVRRGDVRSAILGVLAEAKAAGEHINGYQVIQQIAARSKGEWRPSPGSVYPTIQQLEDEGLIETDEAGGRRAIRLTADGDAWVAEHGEDVAAVWRPFEAAQASHGGDFGRTLKSEIGQVASAVWQLATQGSEAQRSAALEVLVETRRKLYGILADGPEAHGTDEPDEAEGEGS